MMRRRSFRYRRPRGLPLISMLLLLFALLAGGRLALEKQRPSQRVQHFPQSAIWDASFVRVRDGDSLYVMSLQGELVELRLVGINAPELATPRGPASRDYARRLLEGASGLQVEPEPSGDTDKFGRVLAWVWLEHGSGNRQLLNAEMLRARQAELFKHAKPQMKYYEELREAVAGQR